MGYTFRIFVLFLNFLIIYAEPLGKPSAEVKSVNERKYFGVDTYISISRSADTRGIKLDVVQNGEVKQEGLVGLNVPNDVDVQVIHGDNGESKYVFGETVLVMTPVEAPGGQLIKIQWRGVNRERMQDCYNLGEYNWYGGPENWYQAWPIEQLVFNEYSYVTKGENNCAVAEPYWLSSSGLFFYITQDIPLFVDQNNWQDNWVCFISDIKAPYSERRTDNNLNYIIGLFSDPRQAHEYVTNDLFKKPKGVPDYRMTQHPIWSTWAEYKKDIDEATVMDFAQKILDNNFNNSQLEIDDLWETCYGSFNVDTNKFPDFKRLTDNLKAKGFRVTLWIHPFINQGCEPWYTEALENGYFVRNEQGSVDTQWWNSNGATAAYIDFTNPEAAAWWSSRLRNLQTTYGIDSFKFDAGESGSSPQVPVQTGDINLHPGLITTSYVETCAEFGSMIEVRSAKASQDLAVYVRMIDKDSRWTLDNGLSTVLTTLLQMNMNGYPFVLPDMIGGNGYNGRPSKELFIRWLQANVFMPSLQYSYVPWDYDQETTDICRKFTDLHAQYADTIMDTFRSAVNDGLPVNPPIWWVDPTSKAAHPIWDEYLLGEDILVAPILEENAVSRNIYLPIGEWLAEGDPTRIYQGRNWILDYPAPLDTLPYFIRAPLPQN